MANERVLVADDNEASRRLVGHILRQRGHTVLEASCGQDALALLRLERPALAVLDWNMPPGPTGPEIVEALAAEPATAAIPVILLTANAEHWQMAHGTASGARAYLTKPVVAAELLAEVSGLLG